MNDKTNVSHINSARRGRKKSAPLLTNQQWVRMTGDQQSELLKLANMHSMTISQYLRLVVGFAVKEQWQFVPTMASQSK